MKREYIVAGFALLLLSGCAGKTTDPRQGGLFSYNPDAYERRLAAREDELAMIEDDTARQKRKSKKLKSELNSVKSQ